MTALARQNIEVFASYLSDLEATPQGRAKDHRKIAEALLRQNIFQDESVFVAPETPRGDHTVHPGARFSNN